MHVAYLLEWLFLDVSPRLYTRFHWLGNRLHDSSCILTFWLFSTNVLHFERGKYGCTIVWTFKNCNPPGSSLRNTSFDYSGDLLPRHISVTLLSHAVRAIPMIICCTGEKRVTEQPWQTSFPLVDSNKRSLWLPTCRNDYLGHTLHCGKHWKTPRLTRSNS